MDIEKKIRVLMVDDEKDFCTAVSDYLEHQQCIVVPTYDSNQFVNELVHNKPSPDVVLIDKMISDEDGFELIHSIRSNEELQTIPIIVVTACSDVSDRVQALRIGADD